MCNTDKGTQQVEQYIAGFPPAVQSLLHTLTDVVLQEAPEATAMIRYGIPTYEFGRKRVHFAAYARHIGLYPSPDVLNAFRSDLKQYKTSKGTVQFPLDAPLPLDLIRRMIRMRMNGPVPDRPDNSAREPGMDASGIRETIGADAYAIWTGLIDRIEEAYEMDRIGNFGGKDWVYEVKYRRGGKTLCTLLVKPGQVGLLIIFGRKEREKFDAIRADFPMAIQDFYDASTTYHDGKWMWFTVDDPTLFDAYMKLLAIKRRPNRKNT